ncbi:MAG: hypothetical protein QGF99_03070 [Acidimicrobiales bacterium]|mgnify:FL=1|jgi:hypothetical protein|nr:hypothetical protein [Acidimicrobiales bacterium]MDP6900950.1 hypothetical protein [Acidimicrobiales bacterium]HJL98740.1 hypothetical protein [Acidimicrobiales bacterium]
MVIGQALPYGVGDVVRLTATSDDSRQHLIGQTGTVVAIQPGNRFVMAAVKFEDSERRWTMVYDVDQLELIERYGHGVKFLGRKEQDE